MYRDELRKTLLSIDEEASLLLGDSGERLDVILVGGGALILRGLTGRTVTHDIDVFEMNAQLREIISNYPEVNENAAVYCSQMPYNYPDRLCELDIPTQLVRYLTPSLEDLAVMKLYAYRPNDIADLNSEEFLNALDWEQLDRLVRDPDEALASTPSERGYGEMVCAYELYRREHCR